MNLSETVFLKTLHDSGPPLSEADVTEFEREIGSRLPADYREFLLMRNGGRFYQLLTFPLPSREYSDVLYMDEFLRLFTAPDGNPLGLRWNLETHNGRISRDTIPIAGPENLILMDLGDHEPGTLWLWVRDLEMSLEPAENRMPVAPCFSDLVARCRLEGIDSGQETEEPFMAIERFDLDHLRRCLDAGLNPDTRNEEEVTLLVLAARERNYDAVELLLSRGADPNLPDLRPGFTPLDHAERLPAHDLVKLLLRHGAKRQA